MTFGCGGIASPRSEVPVPGGTEMGSCIGARARTGYVLVTPRCGVRPGNDQGGGQADQEPAALEKPIIARAQFLCQEKRLAEIDDFITEFINS